mgnify:CR=1 FL=1
MQKDGKKEAQTGGVEAAPVDRQTGVVGAEVRYQAGRGVAACAIRQAVHTDGRPFRESSRYISVVREDCHQIRGGERLGWTFQQGAGTSPAHGSTAL